MSFDLVVLGSGGGPLENNLSSYFLKARQARWEDGILAVEAGSGIGALRDILVANPLVFQDKASSSLGNLVGGNGSPTYRAAAIYSYVRTFLISHAHFDHIAGLVIGVGSTSSPETRYVAGLPQIIRDLQSIFDGEKLWPRLIRPRVEPALSVTYVYNPISALSAYRVLAPSLSVQLMPISHGTTSQGSSYESTAFFIRNDSTRREFLFFGDVEPDSVSCPSAPASGKNRAVWRMAAPRIRDGVLDHVFLECSYRAGRRREDLYGHLSPEYVAEELKNLAYEVVRARNGLPPAANSAGNAVVGLFTRRRSSVAVVSYSDKELAGALSGMTLVVIHCKEPMPPELPCDDIRIAIRNQIVDRLAPLELGIKVIAPQQGERLVF